MIEKQWNIRTGNGAAVDLAITFELVMTSIVIVAIVVDIFILFLFC